MGDSILKYSTDKLVVHGIDAELHLSDNETVKGKSIQTMLNKIKSLKNWHKINGTNSSNAFIRFPIMKCVSSTSEEKVDYIYAAKMSDVDIEMMQLVGYSNMNIGILINDFNSDEVGGDAYNDAFHNILPYMNGSDIYLTLDDNSDSTIAKYSSAITKYNNRGCHFIVENTKSSSFVLKGAASFVNIKGSGSNYNGDDNRKSVTFYTYYYNTGKRKKIVGPININYISVEMIYTGNDKNCKL